MSSGMWRGVTVWAIPNILKNHVAFICKSQCGISKHLNPQQYCYKKTSTLHVTNKFKYQIATHPSWQQPLAQNQQNHANVSYSINFTSLPKTGNLTISHTHCFDTLTSLRNRRNSHNVLFVTFISTSYYTQFCLQFDRHMVWISYT